MTVRITIIAIILLTVGGNLWAQDKSCTQILQEANTSYQEGSLKFIEKEEFNQCFNADGYSDEERVQDRT